MATVSGTNFSDIIDAQDGVTNLYGDLIYGFGGNDLIFGLGGNDTILGGEGADAIYGGSGNDAASYEDSASGVIVSLVNGSGVGGSANGDTLFSIEYLYGSHYDDLLTGDDGANVMYGYRGHDILKGGGGADLLTGNEGNDTLNGGSGFDLLLGDEGNDTLNGEVGDDTLNGGLGIDDMSGGMGNDIYIAESGDRVFERAGEGYDIVYSYSTAYTLSDNVEVLSLASAGSPGIYGTGNAQSNTIYGNGFDNVLDGGAGSDSLSGLGGNDTFVFRAGQANGDVVYEFNGNGAAAGDVLRFEGYGTLAQGATFHQLSATVWQINSADGLLHEVITLTAGAVIDTTVDIMFV
jgi:Ca2+-binding RTX toxin-like protein